MAILFARPAMAGGNFSQRPKMVITCDFPPAVSGVRPLLGGKPQTPGGAGVCSGPWGEGALGSQTSKTSLRTSDRPPTSGLFGTFHLCDTSYALIHARGARALAFFQGNTWSAGTCARTPVEAGIR